MTFQHGGHACAGGIAGVLGAFGIHLPEHDGSTLQGRINEHHERVTQHVNDARDHVNNTINDVRDTIHNTLGGGSVHRTLVCGARRIGSRLRRLPPPGPTYHCPPASPRTSSTLA